jgi:hypothetical protein
MHSFIILCCVILASERHKKQTKKERRIKPKARLYSNAYLKQTVKTTDREKSNKLSKTASPNKQIVDVNQTNTDSPLQRFIKRMALDYEKWHDGMSYDLEAIKQASPNESGKIEQILVDHIPKDWRDIEALAQIATPNAQEAIKKAIRDPNPKVQIAVARFAPKLISDRQKTQSLVRILQNEKIFDGLSQALDEVEEYHPEEITEELIKGLLSREGEVAVLFAAMLFYIYGKAKEPFDMNQRPFYLTFNTESKTERLTAFLELCKHLKINPEKYVNTNKKN